MFGTGWTEVVALLAAFVIAALATPAGISGAVLLLPFQVSVLGTPSPAATPTNLLYNVIAAPGAIYRYWRQGQAGGRLMRLLLAGTLPGVVAGSIIRVELLPGARVFALVVGAVTSPLGAWITASHSRSAGQVRGAGPEDYVLRPGSAVGRGGVCRGDLRDRRRLDPRPDPHWQRPPTFGVAPASLASTFATSVVGVITFAILSIHQHAHVAPAWLTDTGAPSTRRNPLANRS
jgi:uncharacterized protein